MVMGKSKRTQNKKLYKPIYLLENLGEEDDLDAVLDNWK